VAVAVAVRVAVAVGLGDGLGEHGNKQVGDGGGDVGVAVGVLVAVAVGVGVQMPQGVGVAVGVRVGVAVAVAVGVGVQIGQGVGVGVGLGPDTGTHMENSDVSSGNNWAKAVTLLMMVPGTSSMESLKEPFPWLFVVVSVRPIRVLPSIVAGSQGSVSEKRKIRKFVFGVLCSVPSTVRTAGDEPAIDALVRTGKFCKLLGPVSASRGSLGVTPSGPRSIPNPALRKMLFGFIRANPEDMKTPSPPLKAIRFACMKLLPVEAW
jgi:hypothetical protein